MVRVVIAALLLGHALVHAAYLAPRPPATATGPAWPFELSDSWLLGRFGTSTELSRVIGFALVAATIGGFALAALATLGVMPSVLWLGGVVAGAVCSLSLLLLFFHRWLLLGIAIDLGLLWAVLIARLAPEGVVI